MKKYIFLLILGSLAMTGFAQSEVVPLPISDSVKMDNRSLNPEINLYVPAFAMSAFIPTGSFSPLYMPSFNWDLHKGFNASLSMSATMAFGSNAPSGVGFGTDAAFIYAAPLSKRFSVAAGLYTSTMDWGGFHLHEAGLVAIAAYQLTDKVSLYGFGTKALTPSQYAPFIDPYGSGDKLGAAIKVQMNRNVSFGLSFQTDVSPRQETHRFKPPVTRPASRERIVE